MYLQSLAVDPGVGDAAESGKQRRENKYNIKKQLVSSEELSNALTFATTITKADDEQTEKMFKEFLTGYVPVHYICFFLSFHIIITLNMSAYYNMGEQLHLFLHGMSNMG